MEVERIDLHRRPFNNSCEVIFTNATRRQFFFLPFVFYGPEFYKRKPVTSTRPVTIAVLQPNVCVVRENFFIVTKRDGETRLHFCEKSNRGKFFVKYLSLLDCQE